MGFMKQLQVSGQTWAAGGHGSCSMRFLYCPPSFASVSGHKSEREAGNQATHFYVLYVCVCADRQRWGRPSPVTCPKWNSGGKLRHEACFLNVSRWDSSIVPDFAAGRRRMREKWMQMLKHLLKSIKVGFFIYWCAEKLWTHWRGTWFCPFWLPCLGRASQRYQARVCSQGRSPCAAQHAHEWWNCSKLFDNNRRLTDCYALGVYRYFRIKHI